MWSWQTNPDARQTGLDLEQQLDWVGRGWRHWAHIRPAKKAQKMEGMRQRIVNPCVWNSARSNWLKKKLVGSLESPWERAWIHGCSINNFKIWLHYWWSWLFWAYRDFKSTKLNRISALAWNADSFLYKGCIAVEVWSIKSLRSVVKQLDSYWVEWRREQSLEWI